MKCCYLLTCQIKCYTFFTLKIVCDLWCPISPAAKEIFRACFSRMTWASASVQIKTKAFLSLITEDSQITVNEAEAVLFLYLYMFSLLLILLLYKFY